MEPLHICRGTLFHFIAPSVRNSLRVSLRNFATLSQCKAHLKNFLFRRAFGTILGGPLWSHLPGIPGPGSFARYSRSWVICLAFQILGHLPGILGPGSFAWHSRSWVICLAFRVLGHLPGIPGPGSFAWHSRSWVICLAFQVLGHLP